MKSRSAVPRARDPRQPASIDMGLHVRNGVSLNAADDTGDAPYRPKVYVNDVPRDDSEAPELWNGKSSLYLVQPKSIDMGLLIGNGVSLGAADDTEDAPYRPNVYVNDVPRDDSEAPELWNA